MNTAKCEAMSFPQHGNLLSSISGRTPKDDHKDLAVCDFKKKKEKRTASSKNRTTSRQTYEVYNVDDDGDDNDDCVVDDVTAILIMTEEPYSCFHA